MFVGARPPGRDPLYSPTSLGGVDEGKTAVKWYLAALKKYAIFNGRSRRTEYWMFVLLNSLIGLGLWSAGSKQKTYK